MDNPFLDFARGEARRYLRAASVLLGHAECSQVGRMILLRRAEHLRRLVLAAVEQQLDRAAAPELVDDAAPEPLTGAIVGPHDGRRAMKVAIVAFTLAVFVGVAATATSAAADECKPPAGVNPHKDPSLQPRPRSREARDLMDAGRNAHRASDYTTAIAKFQAAIQIDSAPVLHYMLAQSYRLAGQYKEAITQYDLFLARADPQPRQLLRDLVTCHVAGMKAELEHAASTKPPIDQPEDDATPPNSDAKPAPVPPPQVDPQASDDVDEDRHDGASVAGRWYTDGVGWAITGAGTLSAVVGVGLLFSASDLNDQAGSEDRENVRTDLLSKASSRRTWGTVATVAGLVGVTAGVVRLVLTPDPTPAVERGVSLDVGPTYVGIVGHF
jgi:tetratricopeptide (TPR) repeat protein